MNTKQTKPSEKSMARVVIVGGLVVASLATTGCGGLTAEQVVRLTSASIVDAAYQIGAEHKPELSSKIVANHNETFLVLTF